MITIHPGGKATEAEIRDVADRIRAAIDRQELIDLILELGNIRSLAGYEKEAGDFVYDWMKREAFSPKKVGMVPDRFNVIGEYGGQNPTQGKNLLFTSHLDTESPQYNDLDKLKYRPGSVDKPEWLQASLKDGVFSGRPVENDRGPMACFLIGAKALKKTGLPMAGSLYLTACPAEIGPEHVEEFQGPQFLGKEIGAQFMMTHGGVAPDFAIAAEGTDFGISWVSCGHANFRINIYGEDVFTPLLEHPEELRKHPSALVKVAPLIEALQKWCVEFEKNNIYHSPGGTAVPKTQIGAIRGGDPHLMGGGSEVCSVYLGATLTPVQSIADVQRSLEALMAKELAHTGLTDLHVVPSMHARKTLMAELADGFVALPGGVGTLEELVEMMTWAQLGRHQKPVLIANVEGFWDPLVALLRHMDREGFIRPGFEVGYVVVERAEDIVPTLLDMASARKREAEAAAAIPIGGL